MNRTELFSMKNPAPPTAALENEIKTVSKVEDYLDNNKDYLISQSLSEHLNQLLSQKGVSRADVARLHA